MGLGLQRIKWGGGYFDTLIRTFWFLKTAFVCCLLGYWVFIPTKRKLTAAALVITLGLSIAFPYNQLDFMYPFFLIGGFLWLKHNDISIKNYKWILAISGVCLMSCLIFLDSANYQRFLSNFGSRRIIITDPLMTMIIRSYRILMGLAGTLFFFSSFEIIFAKPRKSKIHSLIFEWGRYTLGIYILQTFLLESFLKRHLVFTDLNPWIFNLIVAPIISLIVMILCVGIIKLIQTNKYLSLILLGQSLHKHVIPLNR